MADFMDLQMFHNILSEWFHTQSAVLLLTIRMGIVVRGVQAFFVPYNVYDFRPMLNGAYDGVERGVSIKL